MKKILLFCIAVLLVVTVASGCNNAEPNAPETTPRVESTVETTEESGTSPEDTTQDVQTTEKQEDTTVSDTVTSEPKPVEPDKTILYGTPTLDGDVDDAYLSSSIYKIEIDQTNYVWGDATKQPYDFAKAYLLWDEDYLYLCVVNVDDTPYSLSGTKTNTSWNNDAAELWFIDETMTYKVHCAADGTFFVGPDADGDTPWDFADAKSASKWTDKGWCVEVALPLNDLDVGRMFTFRLQVNNIIQEDGSAGSASSGFEYVFGCIKAA